MWHSPNRPNFAFYSKDRKEKDDYAAWLMESIPHNFCLYLCPKAVREHLAKRFKSAYLVDIEKFTHRDIFLNLLSMVNDDTLVIMENMARYTILSSDKFNCLHRLRMQTKRRYLIDIVPFTKDVSKLYLPLSYLDREILQYSNGWAFKYNYAEMDVQGRTRRAHDFDFLAEKVSPHCHQGYDQFLPSGWHVIESSLTENEKQGYQARKDELFGMFQNPAKIVTEICDFANMVDSRKEKLCELLSGMKEAVIYTNIVKNNSPIKRYLKTKGLMIGKDIELRTYYAHDGKRIESRNVILFETPINNRFAMIDVIADIAEGAEGADVWHFRNDAKADIYIYGLMNAELQAINQFTIELRRVQNARLHTG